MSSTFSHFVYSEQKLIILIGSILCLKEQIFITYYKSKGIYFSKSVDIIPCYEHLPEKYLKSIKDENLKDICNLVYIIDENFDIENNKVSKVLIKIIDNKDTEIGLYQINGNYYKHIGSSYNFLGSVFKDIIRDKNNAFKGIELFDNNLKLNVKYRIVKAKGDDGLLLNE